MARAKQTEKPFLRGGIADSGTPRAALAFLGGLLIMALLNLILTATFVAIGVPWLRVVFCCAELLIYDSIAYYSGLNRGTAAVALGETALSRREAGKDVSAAEIRRCWHPLKGFLNAFLGTLPFFLAALVYAFLAKRQVFSPGVLPDWVGGMTSRPDVLEPLTVYTGTVPASAADLLRVAVRTLIMPFVGIAGSDRFDAVLTLDRLSPALLLLPAAAYGVGYLMGPGSRARVHAAIDEGEKKRRRKEQRERRRRQAERQPTQLN